MRSLTISLLMFMLAIAGTFSIATPLHAAQGNSSPLQSQTVGPNTSDSDAAGMQTSGQTLANPLKFNSLDELLDGILAAVIKLGSVILTLALIWTGFKFVAARGNEEKIRSARTALMWTVIGGLILLGATAIKEVITSTVGSLTP